ncbi:hypothetical protein QTP88_022180 [Uroleucon formosanum]
MSDDYSASRNFALWKEQIKTIPIKNILTAVAERHASSSRVEDWISSVDGLAQVNQRPLRYRLLYVRSHVTEAAWSWYLLEEFRDWDTFVSKFRATFMRTLRKADLWRELEMRVQEPNEPTIDYFYAKI